MKDTSYFDSNIVDLTLTNVSSTEESTISLFNSITKSQLDNGSSSEVFTECVIPNAKLAPSGSAAFVGFEIHKISFDIWIEILAATNPVGWTALEVKTILESTTGSTWTYEIGAVSTVFQSSSQTTDFDGLRQIITNTPFDYNNYTTEQGTTINIVSGSDLTYNEINSELNNGRYIIENVDIYANTISQANKVFQKNFKDRSGYTRDSNISPIVMPSAEQFVIKDIPLDLLVDKSTLDFSLDASEEVRLIFKYKKSDEATLENPTLNVSSLDDSDSPIILPKSRIIDTANPLIKSIKTNKRIKDVLGKIMYSIPPKKRRQRILEETKKYKLSNKNLKDIISFFENSEYKENS